MLLQVWARATLRNYSLLLMLVLVCYLPLHIAQVVAFADVYSLPPLDLDKAVGAGVVKGGRVGALRVVDVVIVAIEVALLPLLAGGARSAFAADRRGEVPTLRASLRAALSRGRERLGRPGGGWAAAAAILAWAVVATLGSAALDLVDDGVRSVGIALVRALSRAAGAAFVVGALAFSPLRG